MRTPTANTSIDGTSSAESPAADVPRSGSRTLGVCAASVAAAGLWFGLPPSDFKTQAIVGVGDAATPMRAALVDAATSAAVSKPVISRAATYLIGTDIAVPAPGALEKIGVAAGLDKAAGRAARLAEVLVDSVGAMPGDVPGALRVVARSGDPKQAAQMASAVAEALVSEQDDQVAEQRRFRETQLARQLEAAKAEAATARQKFSTLGGVDIDPGQTRATTATQLVAAQGRLDVIRAIIASGTPPMSDRHDVPQSIATLQTSYLDLSQQLAKARETLGERHMTVISLQDGVRRASTNLTAEWKRLNRLAEADVAAVRARDAAARTAETPTNVAKRNAIEEARRAVQAADAAITRLDAARHSATADERLYRLVARAPVPNETSGWSWFARLAASLAGALAGYLLVLRVPVRLPRAPVDTSHWGRDEDVAAPAIVPVTAPAKLAKKPVIETARPAMPVAAAAPEIPALPEPDEDLCDAMDEVLVSLAAITPRGDIPVVVFAANERDGDTQGAALALCEVAAHDGHRVLFVEGERASGTLGRLSDTDADPALLDLFGEMRVVLPSEAVRGTLYVAPAFANASRIVRGLARRDDILRLDDVGTEFDLIIVDAGLVATCTMPEADAILRVGRPAAHRDERLRRTLNAPNATFLGTIAGETFIPRRETVRTPVPIEMPVIRPQPVTETRVQPGRTRPSAMPAPRRKVAGR